MNLNDSMMIEIGEEDGARDEEKSALLLVPFFPEDIVEMIIARMSFPCVFKGRLLSNSWNREFSYPWEDSPPTALTPFQRKLRSVSHTWPSYSPVFINGEGGLKGFDRRSNQWKLTFPNIKLNSIKGCNTCSRLTYSCMGSFVLISAFCKSCDFTSSCCITTTIVRNVVTGSSTKLFPSVQGGLMPELSRLIPGDSDTSFRVIQIHTIRNLGHVVLQTSVYESRVGGWISVTVSSALSAMRNDYVRCGLDSRLCYDNNVYLHGKLYCLCKVGNLGTDAMLCIHHVDSDKTWTGTLLSFPHGVHNGGLLLCGEKVILVARTPSHNVFIYELDLEVLGLWKQLGKHDSLIPFMRLASDDDFVYICGYASRNPMTTFNVHSGEWGSMAPAWHYRKPLEVENDTYMLHSAFTPGLGLFGIVEQRDNQ